MYEKPEPWDKNVPADLIPPITHLRKSFDDAHWDCGWTTQNIYYSLLHSEPLDDPVKEYYNYLMFIKTRVGPAATQRFHDLARQGTPPAVFRAFFDLYIDGVTVEALNIFAELLKIGCANEVRLGVGYVEWAESQTKHLIRSENHSIEMWVRDVCDKHIYDRNEDFEEKIFWRKWQAPKLLVMTPSRFMPYEADSAWEREDVETSVRLLEHFTEDYILRLEVKVRRAAGEAAVELAKQTKLMQPSTPDVNSQQVSSTTKSDAVQDKSPNFRREARKLNTQAMYKSWQKSYRASKTKRPEMSDVWHAQRIAGMNIAKGSSAETIRKHMKPKDG
jgi:hypothetical protein